MDANLHLSKKIEISVGSLTETIVHPRDVLKPAIINNSYGFILAHNHPSGTAKPSKSDDDVTSRIQDAAITMGVKFVDHIIIGKPQPNGSSYFSYRDSKRILH